MKSVFLFLCISFISLRSYADSLEYEAKQLGTMYALADYCGETDKKLNNFELIASRIIANQSMTEEEENQHKMEFVRQRLKVLKKYETNSVPNCEEVLARFRSMPLFQSVVYANGGIKLPDGKYLPPKRPFNSQKKK